MRSFQPFIPSRLLAGILSVQLVGCGSQTLPDNGPGTPPDDDPPALIAIEIAGSDVVTLVPGQGASLTVNGRHDDGTVVSSGLPVTWHARPAASASVDDQGRVTAIGPLGLAWVHASHGALRDSVAVWVQMPESRPNPFKISLYFEEAVPEYVRVAMQRAAYRWERIIRAELPEVEVSTRPSYCDAVYFINNPEVMLGVERGVRVHVGIGSGYPPGTYVGATGGPCLVRALPHPTTVLGAIILNKDRLDIGFSHEEVSYLAYHEMGHTLGLAGAVQQGWQWAPEPPLWAYRAPLALHGWRLAGGGTVSLLDTFGAHWPRGVSDIMGVGGEWEAHISEVSVGSLMDLGYPAAWYGAGPL